MRATAGIWICGDAEIKFSSINFKRNQKPTTKPIKMVKHVLFAALAVSLIYCGCCCAVDGPSLAEGNGGGGGVLDQDAIMAKCNETFRTEMGLSDSIYADTPKRK